jgi:hypothetical protein
MIPPKDYGPSLGLWFLPRSMASPKEYGPSQGLCSLPRIMVRFQEEHMLHPKE